MRDEIEAKKQLLLSRIKKKSTALALAIQELARGEKAAASWREIQHQGDLLKANYHALKEGLSTITLYDWEKDAETTLALNSTLTPEEQLAFFYKKSRKLQKSIPHLAARREELLQREKALQALETAITGAAGIKELEELSTHVLLKKNKSTLTHHTHTQSTPYYRFFSKSGIEILVGKNASSNQQLTLQIAKGHDLWLHAHGLQGSHVIIRRKANAPIDPETIEDAAQLALYYSKARAHFEDIREVLIQERRFLSRRKGAKIGEIIAHGGTLRRTQGNKERLRTIQQRTAPSISLGRSSGP